MFAQAIPVPDSPTMLWIIAAAIVIGGGIMATSMRANFKMANDAFTKLSSLVDQMFVSMQDLTKSNHRSIERLGDKMQTSIDTLCKTHERTWGELSQEIRNFRRDSGPKIDAIHLYVTRDKPE